VASALSSRRAGALSPRSAAQRGRRCASSNLLCLAGIELTKGAIVPPGKGMGGLHQEGPEERAARLADAALAVLLARLDNRRIEAGVAGHLFGTGETMGISHNGPRGSRRDEPHARDRQQQRCRLSLLGATPDHQPHAPEARRV
jgi:hypothetical protein